MYEQRGSLCKSLTSVTRVLLRFPGHRGCRTVIDFCWVVEAWDPCRRRLRYARDDLKSVKNVKVGYQCQKQYVVAQDRCELRIEGFILA